ncbi:MAG: hypothetical protein ACHP6H_03215 [Legionellales bacterium]
MDVGELLTEQELLSDILMQVGDTDLKKGITLGYYKSRLQQAIEKLAISTFYDVLTGDYTMPKNFISPLPVNCFNIREVYLWNGSCCQPEHSVIVHFKRLFNNKPNGQNYTALRNDKNHDGDPFYNWGENGYGWGNGGLWGPFALYYANIQNGHIMFSSNAQGYSNYRLVYNGFGGEIGNPPLVPRLLRDVVIDMVVCSIFQVFMAREPRTYITLFREYNEKLYNYRSGTFWEAKNRISAMNTWARTDYETYQDRPNI